MINTTKGRKRGDVVIKAPDERKHNNLKALREQQGMTARQLADAVGVSQQMVWYYENGIKGMSLSKAIKIADILGCTVDDLVKGA